MHVEERQDEVRLAHRGPRRQPDSDGVPCEVSSIAFGVSEIRVAAETQVAARIAHSHWSLFRVRVAQQMYGVLRVRIVARDALDSLDKLFASGCDASDGPRCQVTGNTIGRGGVVTGQFEDVGVALEAVLRAPLRTVADRATGVAANRSVLFGS